MSLKTGIQKEMVPGDQKRLPLPKTPGLEFSSEGDLPLGTILPPRLHEPPPAMITPEILLGSDLRTWVFPVSHTHQQRAAGNQSPLPSPFLTRTDDCLQHLQSSFK